MGLWERYCKALGMKTLGTQGHPWRDYPDVGHRSAFWIAR